MAILQYSTHLTRASGKLGGSVFNTDKKFARSISKVQPSATTSKYQITRRIFIQKLSQRWRKLTAAQRKRWNAAAKSGSWVSVKSHKHINTGFHLYISQNYYRFFTGLALLTVPLPRGQVRTILSLLSIVSTTGSRYDTWCSVKEGNVQIFGEVRASLGHAYAKKSKAGETCTMRFSSWTAGSQNLYTTQYRARYGKLQPVGTWVKIELYIWDANLVQVTDRRIFWQRVT